MRRVTSTKHLAQMITTTAGEIRPGQWIGTGAGGWDNQCRHPRTISALCEIEILMDDERLTQAAAEGKPARGVFRFHLRPRPNRIGAGGDVGRPTDVESWESRADGVSRTETLPPRASETGHQRDRTTGNLVAASLVHTARVNWTRSCTHTFHRVNRHFDETDGAGKPATGWHVDASP